MAAAQPWTAEDDNTLKALHAEGKSLHAISQQTGRSKSTLSIKAKKLGLDFNREITKAATEAYVADRKNTRARIIADLYDRAQYLLDTLNQPRNGGTYRTLVPVGGGAQNSQNLNHVPPADERNTANALSSYLSRAEALEKLDSDGGMEEARGMLAPILQAIRESVQTQPRINPKAAA